MTPLNAKELGRYMDSNPDNNSSELWEGSNFKEKEEEGDDNQWSL